MLKLLYKLVVGFFVLAIGYHLAGGLSPAQAQSSPSHVLKNVRLQVSPELTRVVLDLSSPAEYSLFTLENPSRVVIDLKDANATFSPNSVSGLAKAEIKSLRMGVRDSNDLRMVLDLSRDLTSAPKAFAMGPKGQLGHRLVIDLPRQSQPTQALASQSKTTDTASARQTAADKPEVVTSQPQNNQVSRASQASQISQTNQNSSRTPQSRVISKRRDVIVAIDAGHGGNDPGAIGPAGSREKDIVLALSRRLAQKINAEPGMRAVLVRNGDYYVSLKKRMKIAREQNADLFLSIHADAFHQSQVRGSSVYVLSQRGASSEAAKWLAQKQNAADLIGGVKLADKDDELAEVLLDLSQTATMSASYDAANLMVGQIGQVNKLHKRKVQDAGFVVLKSPDVPSMLIETAFLSNPQEEKNLRSKAYQNRLTTAITQGVKQYFYQQPPEDSLIAAWVRPNQGQRVHVISRGETLGGIAQRYGVTVTQLRSINHLTSDNIRVGQKLAIPITQASR